MTAKHDSVTLYEGRHLSLLLRDRWEFASRKTNRPAVAIVAITDAGNVVLVEQFRVPVGRAVVELPAGLTGDLAGSESESLLDGAKRELLEETGYAANEWIELGRAFSSPGMTDEELVFFLARSLEIQTAGGGDGSESIRIHEVPVGDVVAWLRKNELSYDLKLFTGLYAAQPYLLAR